MPPCMRRGRRIMILSMPSKPRPGPLKTRPDELRVFLARHGQTTFNHQKRFQGWNDEPQLTDKGNEEARLLARFIQQVAPQVVYCSPLQRARQTAAIVVEEYRRNALPALPLVVDSRLREIHLPPWEGMSYTDVLAQFPRQWEAWKANPHLLEFEADDSSESASHNGSQVPGTGFRPVHELFNRARAFWNEFLRHERRSPILVVAHSGINRALLSTALGVAEERFSLMQQSNAATSALCFSSPPSLQNVRLESLNLTHYLKKPMPKLKSGRNGVQLILLPAAGETTAPSGAEWLLKAAHAVFIVCADDPSSRRRLHDLSSGEWIPQPRFVEVAWFESWIQNPLTLPANGGFATVPEEATTGLVIAPRHTLAALLLRLFGLQGRSQDALPVHQRGASILHYPAGSKPPVIQSINFPIDGPGHDAPEKTKIEAFKLPIDR